MRGAHCRGGSGAWCAAPLPVALLPSAAILREGQRAGRVQIPVRVLSKPRSGGGGKGKRSVFWVIPVVELGLLRKDLAISSCSWCGAA